MTEKSKIEVHIHGGGQCNIALDNAHLEAQQNNVIKTEQEVIQTFLDVIHGESYIHKMFEGGKETSKIATEDDVKNFSDIIIEEYRHQLDTRLSGTESKLQIICRLLQEIEETINTEKRYGVLPMFSYVPRGTEKGYVFLDGSVMPFDSVEIEEYYWDAYEKYIIINKYYHLMVVLHDEQVVYIEVGYTLCFSDVVERLYGFKKIKEIENSIKIHLLISKTNKKIELEMLLLGGKRDKLIEKTDYWIEQMEMIDSIEKFFKIKFFLPPKAKEEDYHSIYTLYQSISKLQTSTISPLPIERELFRKVFKIQEEIIIDNGNNFPSIYLFGYQFKPVVAYLMECTLIWKKKIRAWEQEKGGVPVRVEFICYKSPNEKKERIWDAQR